MFGMAGAHPQSLRASGLWFAEFRGVEVDGSKASPAFVAVWRLGLAYLGF